MQRILKCLILALMLVILGCATVSLNQNSVVETTLDETQFDCEFPEGRDYECYSDEECNETMRGYGAVMVHRFHMKEKEGWYKDIDVQIVPIHLWIDHESLLLLGRLEGEMHSNGKLFMKLWTETYDLECELLDTGYAESYMGEYDDSKLK